MQKVTLTSYEEGKHYIVDPVSGCWDWSLYTMPHGYGTLRYEGVMRLAHRVSYELYKEDPEGGFVCHKCDNPRCVNPDHLFLGSQKDNMQDAARKGRVKRGGDSHLSKLKEEDIRKIKSLLSENNLTQRSIGYMFGVCQATISLISTGVNWKHTC